MLYLRSVVLWIHQFSPSEFWTFWFTTVLLWSSSYQKSVLVRILSINLFEEEALLQKHQSKIITVCKWWTGRPGVLLFMGSQRVGQDWATALNWLNGYLAPQLKDTRGAQMKDRQLLSRDTEQSKLGIRWEASLTSLPPTNTVAKSMYVQKLYLQVLT